MKAALAAISLVLGFALYVPLWTRIIRRRSSSDFSKASYIMILALQVVNELLAVSENASYLAFIYAAQIVCVSATLALIYKYFEKG